jgi:diketogulonate reductase-like aldo/keto reductase
MLRNFCDTAGIAVIAYASFGCGHLLTDGTVVLWSGREDVSPGILLLRWALDQKMCVIPKSEHPQRIKAMSPNIVLSQALSPAARAALDSMPHGRKFCWDPAAIST